MKNSKGVNNNNNIIIIKIGLINKSFGELRRLAVTQTPVEDHQLMLVWKTLYNNKKKRTCKIVDFAVPADHRIKLKECEKKDKYLDLARELKILWKMKVTIIRIIIGAFKGLLKGLEDLEVGGRLETVQTTALLRTARILRRVLEVWGDLLSLKLQWNTIS